MKKKLKVLLVDDNEEIREISKFYFESIREFGDFTFFEANSGSEAAAIIYQNPDLDIVLADYNMPNGNGLSVLADLRKSSEAPFLLHSGEDWSNLKTLCQYKNVYSAEKPLDIAKLRKILELIFSENQKKAG